MRNLRKNLIGGLAGILLGIGILAGCADDHNAYWTPQPVSFLAHKWDGNAGFNIIKRNPDRSEENISDLYPRTGEFYGFRDFNPMLSPSQDKLCFIRFNGVYGTFDFSQGKHNLIVSDFSKNEDGNISISNPQVFLEESGKHFMRCNFNSDGTKIISPVYGYFSGTDYTAIIDLQTGDIAQIPTPVGYVSNWGAAFGSNNKILENMSQGLESKILVRDLNDFGHILEKTEPGINVNSQIFLKDGKLWYFNENWDIVSSNSGGGNRVVFPSSYLNSNPKPSSNGDIYHGCIEHNGEYPAICITNPITGTPVRITGKGNYGSPFPLE